MKHLTSIFILSMSLILVPSLLVAQEKEVTLEEVVVTATRDKEEVSKIPANVTVITKEQIEESHVEAVVNLLRDEVGVVVKDFYGNGKSATVDLRGFGEVAPTNVLVLVDGRRVNEIDLSGVDWTQIPLEQIERIEVVRGSGSVLYGDNAVGGVINIITKKPEKPFSFQTGVALGSYNFNREYGSVSGKWGPLSANLTMGYNATEGYRDNGLLRAKNVGGKIIYDLNDDVSFNLSGAFNRDKQGLAGPLTQEEIDRLGRRATVNPNNQAETDDGYGDLGARVKLWNAGRIEADLSYRERNIDNVFDFPQYLYGYTDERSLRTWGFTPRYLLDEPISGFGNRLTLGMDLYRSDSKVKSTTTEFFFDPPVTVLNESDIIKSSLGVYGYDEFSVLKNLILSLGFRYEWATYDISQQNPYLKDTANYGESAWNIGLNYLFEKWGSAFLTAKRSFRFPTTDELVQILPAQVNPNMKPQTGYDFEAGIRFTFNDRIQANVTGFWIDTTDEIFFNPVTFANENFPKTRRLGFEIGCKVALASWFSAWANYSYTDATLQSDLTIGDQILKFSGNQIPGVPKNKGAIGISVEPLKGLLLSANATLVGSQYFTSDWANQFGKLDGYGTVNARLSYTWKGLNVFIGVNNIFNAEYSEVAVVDAFGKPYYYPSPEINFIGGISYTF